MRYTSRMARRFQFSLPDLLAAVITAALCGSLSMPLMATRFLRSYPNHPELTVVPILVALTAVNLLALAFMKPPEFPSWERCMWFVAITAMTWAIAFGFCFGNSVSRIETNEAAAAAFCRRFAEAQEVFHRADRDGDGVLEYAQSLKELATALPSEISKAEVEAELRAGQTPNPCHGYCFKLLFSAASPNSDRKNFLANGNLTGGYALIAYPADYGKSGLRTYRINNSGTVLVEDLGAATKDKAAQMTDFVIETIWMHGE